MIEKHITWEIYDSSKVEEYMNCPRRYFYRYILGWAKDSSNIHLDFGTSWHLFQAQLLKGGFTPENVMAAYKLFEDRYRLSFPDEMTDVDRAPKIPAVVRTALPKYIDFAMNHKDHNKEVLYTEIAGTAPINMHGRVIHFKMDSILRDPETKQIESLEHKTASAMSRQNQDKWKLCFQTGCYNHVLHCLYPFDDIYGVNVNLAVFTKGKGGDFARIPSRRSIEGLEVWLWQANSYIDDIYLDTEHIQQPKEEEKVVMEYFRRNEESCTQYAGCPYFDFCTSWANPLQHCDYVPEGFVQRFWNPKERDEEITYVELKSPKEQGV